MKKTMFTLVLCALLISPAEAKEKITKNLEEKYNELSILLREDINSIKNTVNERKGNYSEEEFVDSILEETISYVTIQNKSSLGEGKYESSSLPTATKGAIFYTAASTFEIEHGHTGIYVDSLNVAEAPGGNNTSRVISINDIKVAKGATEIYIVNSLTISQKNVAGDWAKNMALTKRPYNNAFYANKTCSASASYNCSQLVWCAYGENFSVNLDSNGGPGVYPRDIRNSSHLTFAVGL